jgi:hypothetical protein
MSLIFHGLRTFSYCFRRALCYHPTWARSLPVTERASLGAGLKVERR